MASITTLETGYNEQLNKLYRIFVESVIAAPDKEKELKEASERFRAGMQLLTRIDTVARQIVESTLK